MTGSKRNSRSALKILPIGASTSEPDQKAKANGHLVEQLATAAIYASGHLVRCPHFLLAMLEAEAWRHFADPHTRQTYNYDDIDAFARARIPAGLQIPDGVAGLIRICQNIPCEESDTALRMLRSMIPAEASHGGRRVKQPDSIRLKYGTSETYLIRRLKRDKPNLAARVIAGELTANAAAIEAGIRQRMVQCPATVDGFTRSIRKHLTAQELKVLKEQL